MPNNAYCIKAGYQSNLAPASFDEDGSVYWTPQRVTASLAFQFHVYQTAQRLMRERSFRTVLEVGCGPAAKTRQILAPAARRIVLVDQPSVERMATRMLPQAEYIATNLERPSFPGDEQFDLVLCADVIEHLLDPDPCLLMMREHLQPQGLLVLSTPDRDVLRGRNCMASPKRDHVREWNRTEFAEFVVSRGFDIVQHGSVPQRRLSAWEFAVSCWLGSIWPWARWVGCQMIIARIRSMP